MTINTDQLLESILDSLDRIDYVKSEDIPDIQLYMDQVTTSWILIWLPPDVIQAIRS